MSQPGAQVAKPLGYTGRNLSKTLIAVGFSQVVVWTGSKDDLIGRFKTDFYRKRLKQNVQPWTHPSQANIAESLGTSVVSRGPGSGEIDSFVMTSDSLPNMYIGQARNRSPIPNETQIPWKVLE